MTRSVVAALACLAGCGPDSTPFQIQFELQRGDSYKCSSDSCANVGMSCDSAMLIRIVDANDENIAHLQQCEYIEANGALCQLGTITLEPVDVPNHPVRVQVAVWSLDEIDAFNPALRMARECPSMTFEPISGEPAVQPSPALWGQTYFQVGTSSVASIVLNCGDVGSLDTMACRSSGQLHVTASVDDFVTLISVPPQAVHNLTVTMGEPVGPEYSDVTPMSATFVGTVSRWEANRVQGFLHTACIQVFGNDLNGAAHTLRCRPVVADEISDGTLDAEGMFVDRSTIDKIEVAVGGFAATGVVIGRVLDAGGNPAAGAIVSATNPGTIQYLSDDMTTTVADMTSSSGLFVSKDIKYYDDTMSVPTEWTASMGQVQSVGTVVGGIVNDNITIVIIRLAESAP